MIVIGAGFSGLAAAALLARKGFTVTVLEKNSSPGGRARVWKKSCFTFDMGPSWYLMPEVFEKFFAALGKKPSDYFRLVKLHPSYRIFFPKGNSVEVSPLIEKNVRLFERLEPGAGAKLRHYLKDAKLHYNASMREFLYREYSSIFDFFSPRVSLRA